jgi:LysM repeat protein
MISGYYYCIQVGGGTTTSSSSSPTTTGDGVSTPSPIQTGMVSTCDKFYLVQSGDTCDSIIEAAGISLATFYAWNPAVGSSCATLDVDDYVCIDILGYTITSVPASTTTTSPADGISTPTPIQTGMVSTCNNFYLVQSGDTCASIVATAGISLANFYAWNPAVGSTCAYLDLGDYVCIGIIGSTATTSSSTVRITATLPSNGIPTPTPYQTGMATNCDKFHLVVSGDQCGNLATQYGISLAQFYSWNPAVGTSCQYLDLDDYVCVGVETCTSASVLAGRPQDQLTCGAPGASHDNAGSLLIISYTAGSPYVESAAACGAQCIATSGCTNLYFIEGSYCNLHEGASTFAESTVSPYYIWYEAACFAGNNNCGVPGASHDDAGSLLITSYTAGSPYVESAAACGAQCLATPSCTNLYFIEGSYCNLHQGSSTFAESTVAPFYYWYSASCFSSGDACGSYGFSNDTVSTVIVSYTSGSSYVESAEACGAQCLSTSECTNVYFIQGSYCNLHSPSSFYASTASGYYSWYDSGCFACNALSV